MVNLTLISFKRRNIADDVSVYTSTQNYSIGTIGTLELVFDTNKPTAGNLSGVEWYIKAGLFLPAGYSLEPTTGDTGQYWYYQNDTPALTTTYNMQWSGTALNRNMSATITFTNNGSNKYRVTVLLTMVFVEDLLEYAGNVTPVNQRRFLYTNRATNNLLENTSPSVYSETRTLRLTAWCKETTGSSIDWSNVKGSDSAFSLRWYNKDTLNVAPTLVTVNNTTQGFSAFRNNVAVDAFSSLDYTDIKFRFTTAQTYIKVMFWLIKTNVTDNSVIFPTNYAGDFVPEIPTSVGSSAITGSSGDFSMGTAFYSPSTAPTLVSGTTYETTFRIAPQSLGSKFRLIAQVFVNNASANGPYEAYSFITPLDIEVYPLPILVLPTAIGSISNYFATFGEYLTVSPLERLQSNVTFNGDTYDVGRITALKFLTVMNSVKLSIYELTDAGLYHVMEQYTIKKDGSGAWDNLFSNITISEDTTDNELHVKYNYRVRMEPNTPNLTTLDSALKPLSQPTSTQDWTGRTLVIEIELTTQNNVSGAPTTNDIMIYKQRIVVRELDTCVTGKLLDTNGNQIKAFCDTEESAIIEFENCDPGNTDDVIYFLDNDPFGVTTLKEFDPSVGNGLITPLNNTPMLTGDTTFTTGKANVKIDPTQLDLLTQYRACILHQVDETEGGYY